MRFQQKQNIKNDKNSFKILITTDNHLGYKENDKIRGLDTFDSFEEALEIAKRELVDFVLLGGDLFHESNPTQQTLHRATQILENKIFGENEISFNTYNNNEIPPNFANYNLNIDLPIYIIHGNHDYPCNYDGQTFISVLDLFQAGNFLNYFGKCQNYENFIVEPIYFEKNNTKIAIYGIGHIKDARLFNIFDQKRIKFVNKNPENYFNILVLHQNKFKGNGKTGANYKQCVHMDQFPDFIDFVIWGHEHESMPLIEANHSLELYFYQPGSTAITSLIGAEQKNKHVGIIELNEKEFSFTPIQLQKSLRNLLYQKIDLKDQNQIIDKIIRDQINSLYEQFNDDENSNKKKLPLIRLKINYSGFDTFSIKKIEDDYQDKVANQGDIIQLYRSQQAQVRNQEQIDEMNINFNTKLKNKQNLANNQFTNVAMLKNSILKEISLCQFNFLHPNLHYEELDKILRDETKKQQNAQQFDKYIQKVLENIEYPIIQDLNQQFDELLEPIQNYNNEFVDEMLKQFDTDDVQTIEEKTFQVEKLDEFCFDFNKSYKKKIQQISKNYPIGNNLQQYTESNQTQQDKNSYIEQKLNTQQIDLINENEDSQDFISQNFTNLDLEDNSKSKNITGQFNSKNFKDNDSKFQNNNQKKRPINQQKTKQNTKKQKY